MKLSFSFILCGVLIYATNVAAVGSDEISEMEPPSKAKLKAVEVTMEACTVDYLKRKGKFDKEFPLIESTTSSFFCIFLMPLTVALARKRLYDTIESKFPDNGDCIMREYHKKHNSDDYLSIIMTKKAKSFTGAEEEAFFDNLQSELKEQMKPAAAECNVEEDKFVEKFSEGFFERNEAEAVSETA